MPSPHLPTVPVERLEQQLLAWEELMWCTNCVNRISSIVDKRSVFGGLTGPIMHYAELREHLLQIKDIAEYDMARFSFPDALLTGNKEKIHELKLIRGFPFGLAHWTLSSRRVFHLSADLQAILSVTSLGKLRIQDVPWPFESFALSIERPLFSPKMNRSFDLLLLHPPAKEEQVRYAPGSYRIQLLDHRLRVWKPYQHKKLIEKLIAERNYLRAMEILVDGAVLARSERLLPTSSWISSDTRTLEEMFAAQDPRAAGLWRLVIAFVVYLRGKQDVTKYIGPWIKPQFAGRPRVLGSSPSPRAITDASRICHVTSVYTLTDVEREEYFRLAEHRPSGYELPYHMRIAHSRARWGARKADPDALKTVSIKSTHVRLDRKPASGVSGGSKVLL